MADDAPAGSQALRLVEPPPPSEEGTKSTAQSSSQIPWAVVVPAVLVAAVVLLVGLPLGTVLIMNASGCCLTGGPEKVITFWASMIAGFLTLFGMIVTGIFVLTSFKTKEIATAEAQSESRRVAQSVSKFVASQTTQTFIQDRKGEMFQQLEQARDDAAKVAAEVKELDQEIARVRTEATRLQSEIMTVRDETNNAARAAQEAIGAAAQEVERLHTSVTRGMNDALAQAEAAVKELREQVDRSTGSAQGGTADQPDER